jgi:hypothetical protein
LESLVAVRERFHSKLDILEVELRCLGLCQVCIGSTQDRSLSRIVGSLSDSSRPSWT